MSKSADVLERSVIHEGKVFITAGEENARAYIIQSGRICSFMMQNDKKIIVSTYGAGTLIGEMCLLLDTPIPLSYQAMETTTVVTITRQDFQKKLVRIDKTIKTVLDHLIKKIEEYESLHMQKASDESSTTEISRKLLRNLVGDISEDKKLRYERALLPHINGLLKELQKLKETK